MIKEEIMEKERLDILLVKRNLADSREKAKRYIMAGLVFSNEERLDKPGMKVAVDIPLSVKEQMRYVSRGGYKLEKALNMFDTDIENKIVADIGASTGGFTDCALQNQAELVYAIDVGYNQLAWQLRNDERVVVHERVNFRHATEDLFIKGLPNYATIDVSFISLKLILPKLAEFLLPNSEVVALVKPQFEAEREEVGKKGVIRDPKIHESVLERVIQFVNDSGFEFLNLSFSPITGKEGNIEYLIHLGWKTGREDQFNKRKEMILKTIEQAYENLRQK